MLQVQAHHTPMEPFAFDLSLSLSFLEKEIGATRPADGLLSFATNIPSLSRTFFKFTYSICYCIYTYCIYH